MEYCRGLGRRSFISMVLSTVGGLVGVFLGNSRANATAIPFKRGNRKEIPASALAKLKKGVPVRFPQARAWLSLGPKDKLRAFDEQCTHKGCQLDWNSKEKLYKCPCHGSQFNPDGSVKQGPAERPMTALEIKKEKDGSVQLVDKPRAHKPRPY